MIKTLSLENFRNYQKKHFTFTPGTTLIIGPNAVGKTNIIEAIYLLARGKSFRAQLEREMIDYGEELARVEGKIKQLNNETMKQLEVVLTTGQVQGKRAAGKIFKVNGVGRWWKDFVGQLKVVLFRPEDIEIVLGSPAIRRAYLDMVLEQVDSLYRQCNLVYQKGLRQRNKLLDKIRDGEAKRSQLEYWNRLLIKNGEIISRKREELIEIFNFQSFDKLRIDLLESERPRSRRPEQSRMGQFSIFNKNLTIYYDKSAISPERLEKYAQAEVALGMTLVGPQRDDIKLKIKNSKLKIDRELALFGSRGEQRMAVLALKMAELAFVSQKVQKETEGTETRPVLLLDDIFSELDEEHRLEVLSLIDQQQTIITTTEIDLVPKRFLSKMERIVISNS